MKIAIKEAEVKDKLPARDGSTIRRTSLRSEDFALEYDSNAGVLRVGYKARKSKEVVRVIMVPSTSVLWMEAAEASKPEKGKKAA